MIFNGAYNYDEGEPTLVASLLEIMINGHFLIINGQ